VRRRVRGRRAGRRAPVGRGGGEPAPGPAAPRWGRVQAALAHAGGAEPPIASLNGRPPVSTEAADAVVIGAGHNGLVAANLLADAGWSVLVLEATEHVGGAVRTAEVTEPGFRNDLFSAFYPLSAVSPVIRGLKLEKHGLRWRHAPDVLAHVLP